MKSNRFGSFGSTARADVLSGKPRTISWHLLFLLDCWPVENGALICGARWRPAWFVGNQANLEWGLQGPARTYPQTFYFFVPGVREYPSRSSFSLAADRSHSAFETCVSAAIACSTILSKASVTGIVQQGNLGLLMFTSRTVIGALNYF